MAFIERLQKSTGKFLFFNVFVRKSVAFIAQVLN